MDSNPSGITLSLLDPLYEAATQPEMWKVFLEKAATALRSDKAAILLHAPGNARTSICFDLGISEEMRRDTEAMMKFSPWAQEIQKHQSKGYYSGSPDDLMSVETIRKSFFYNEYFRKHNIEWALTAIIFDIGGASPSLAVARPKTSARFNESEKEVLRQLVPHLARVFKVHGLVTALRNQNAAGQRALDLVGSACVTLDRNGRVLSMNRRAELVIAEAETLRMKDHKLLSALTSEQGSLDSCILPACACGVGRSSDPGAGALVLHSPQGNPLYVSVLPYSSSWSFFESRPAALVFITTPEEQGHGEHRLWRAMFALSPAECRVAEMMKQGMEVAEISEAIKIKVDTVRYYQKCVYRKTGVRGQCQLMRLLARLPSTTP